MVKLAVWPLATLRVPEPLMPTEKSNPVPESATVCVPTESTSESVATREPFADGVRYIET